MYMVISLPKQARLKEVKMSTEILMIVMNDLSADAFVGTSVELSSD